MPKYFSPPKYTTTSGDSNSPSPEPITIANNYVSKTLSMVVKDKTMKRSQNNINNISKSGGMTAGGGVGSGGGSGSVGQ